MNSQDIKTGLLLKQLERKQKRRSLKFAFHMILVILAVLIACFLGFVVTNAKAEQVLDEHPIKETSIQMKTVEEPVVLPEEEIVLEASSAPIVEEAGFEYEAEIPMPIAHQEYLYDLCMERGLDYKKALAIIQHESVYNSYIVSDTNDYGYFQINTVNHERLANTLQTANNPLDPYININWGTYMLSDLYEYWSKQGITGDALDVYVWSSYNKGLTGFKKYGPADEYVEKVRVAFEEVSMILDI